eukprot:jgi/Mesvir1/13020/Mv06019-RA.2
MATLPRPPVKPKRRRWRVLASICCETRDSDPTLGDSPIPAGPWNELRHALPHEAEVRLMQSPTRAQLAAQVRAWCPNILYCSGLGPKPAGRDQLGSAHAESMGRIVLQSPSKHEGNAPALWGLLDGTSHVPEVVYIDAAPAAEEAAYFKNCGVPLVLYWKRAPASPAAAHAFASTFFAAFTLPSAAPIDAFNLARAFVRMHGAGARAALAANSYSGNADNALDGSMTNHCADRPSSAPPPSSSSRQQPPRPQSGSGSHAAAGSGGGASGANASMNANASIINEGVPDILQCASNEAYLACAAASGDQQLAAQLGESPCVFGVPGYLRTQMMVDAHKRERDAKVALDSPLVEVRVLLCGHRFLVDPAPLVALSASLQTLLQIEVQGVTVVVQAVGTVAKTVTTNKGLSSFRCLFRTGSGGRAAVSATCSSSVLKDPAATAQVIRSALLKDAASTQVINASRVFSPSQVVPPLPGWAPACRLVSFVGRRSAAIAAGAPVVEVVTAMPSWAQTVLHQLATDGSYRGLAAAGIAGIAGMSVAAFGAQDTERVTTLWPAEAMEEGASAAAKVLSKVPEIEPTEFEVIPVWRENLTGSGMWANFDYMAEAEATAAAAEAAAAAAAGLLEGAPAPPPLPVPPPPPGPPPRLCPTLEMVLPPGGVAMTEKAPTPAAKETPAAAPPGKTPLPGATAEAAAPPKPAKGGAGGGGEKKKSGGGKAGRTKSIAGSLHLGMADDVSVDGSSVMDDHKPPGGHPAHDGAGGGRPATAGASWDWAAGGGAAGGGAGSELFGAEGAAAEVLLVPQTDAVVYGTNMRQHNCARRPLAVCTEEEFLVDLISFCAAEGLCGASLKASGCLKADGSLVALPEPGAAVSSKGFKPTSFPADAKLNGYRVDLFGMYREVTEVGGFKGGAGIDWENRVQPALSNFNRKRPKGAPKEDLDNMGRTLQRMWVLIPYW